MVSNGTNFSEFVPSKADGVRDYNDSGRNIRVGFAGSSLGLGNSDAEQNVKYLAGYTESGKHIKDVNLNAAKQYLGINNVNNTADSSKSVNYANSAGTANRVANTGDATANAARHVWFSDSTTETARVSNNNFKYNPIGNILTVNVSGNAATASTANRAIEVADYNDTNQGIKIGFAGNGFTASDFQYALGMNHERKIKDVSKDEYRKWLGLGSAAYTSSSNYAANDVVTISSSQPTSSTCKLWIKI